MRSEKILSYIAFYLYIYKNTFLWGFFSSSYIFRMVFSLILQHSQNGVKFMANLCTLYARQFNVQFLIELFKSFASLNSNSHLWCGKTLMSMPFSGFCLDKMCADSNQHTLNRTAYDSFPFWNSDNMFQKQQIHTIFPYTHHPHMCLYIYKYRMKYCI